MPYCPHCGTELATDAAFCSACGARLREQAGPAPAGTAAPGREARSWAIIAGLAGVVVLVIVGIVLYTTTSGDDGDSVLEGAGETVLPGGTPTRVAPSEPSPTLEFSTPTGTPAAPPTFTPVPVAGYATPEEAIGAFLAEQGLDYAGDCSFVDLDRDIGFYCSSLWEDQFDTRIYMAGLAFSEPDTWLLVARLGARDDWTVVDFAGLDPFAEDLEPPWP